MLISYDQFYSNLPVIYFILFSFLCPCFMLFGGWVLGEKSQSKKAHIPFESGIDSVGDAHLCFSIKFYLVAIVFVIFDVESVYIYSWITTIYDNCWIGFIEMSVFILELLLGLVYVIKLGILDWSKE